MMNYKDSSLVKQYDLTDVPNAAQINRGYILSDSFLGILIMLNEMT